MNLWTIDECRDANGHCTIRLADGSANGNTAVQPIATVFDEKTAIQIVMAHNAGEVSTILQELCKKTLEHLTDKKFDDFDEEHVFTGLEKAIDYDWQKRLVRLAGDIHDAVLLSELGALAKDETPA